MVHMTLCLRPSCSRTHRLATIHTVRYRRQTPHCNSISATVLRLKTVKFLI